MPIGTESDFSRAILDEATQEAEEILDLARREAERILDGAREELEKVYLAESPQTATQMAKTRYKQLVAAAELETRKQKILAQERLIAEVVGKVKQRLSQARQESWYPTILARLIEQGVKELDGDHFEIIVAPEDRPAITREFLEELSRKTASTLTLSDVSAPAISGVIIQRADRRVRCDNTLQGLFRRQEHAIRLQIAQHLFEGM